MLLMTEFVMIRTRDEGWLDVERAAVVEVTSEDKRDPAHARVRSAMVAGRRELAQRNCASAVEFQPTRAIRELEEYQVELSNVAVLELVIKPNIGGGLARASLKNLRLS